jgi:oleate hydratase
MTIQQKTRRPIMTATYQSSNGTTERPMGKKKAYLVGGGIASLASAVFLIRDGHLPGKNIHIFEESDLIGGSLDGQGSAETGYIMRGGRMFDEEAYTCTYDLLSSLPSLNDPGKTVRDEMIAFNKQFKIDDKARLVDGNGNIVDGSALGLSWGDRLALMKMLAQSEGSLGTRRIDECFAPSFFTTNFWSMWCTTFAFQPWHSAVELKRYLHRFLHEFPRIYNLAGVRRTPYNQYDSIVLPVTEWLKGQGVHFEMSCQVTNLDVQSSRIAKTVECLHLLRAGKLEEIVVTEDDLVFVTIGSMTAGSSLGSMTSAPGLNSKHAGGSWALWETLAKDQPDFGQPSVFDDHIDESLWESFTVTFRDPTFRTFLENFTGNTHGTGALVTFKDSNWLLSLVMARQPHFRDQPDDVTVCWGYSLFPNKKGDYVQKKMTACTGEEILTELCSHLRFTQELPHLLKTSTCIPSLMPFITSQFLVRAKGDRPLVVPKGSTNLAFLGQFAEIPDDVVFTVDYSVRSAQIAVYTLLKLDKEVTPIYKGERDPRVLLNSAVTMLK